jgi:hypothetical protein
MSEQQLSTTTEPRTVEEREPLRGMEKGLSTECLLDHHSDCPDGCECRCHGGRL